MVDADNVQIGDKLAVTSGQTDEGTFPLAAGTYTLLCDVPGHENMKAALLRQLRPTARQARKKISVKTRKIAHRTNEAMSAFCTVS